jgi:citrate synthase
MRSAAHDRHDIGTTGPETVTSPLDRWSRIAEASATIDMEVSPTGEYVSAGLRDVSGKGVVAGLTRIGDVVGQVMVDGVLTPVPGRLMYRGIDIETLVDGFAAENRFGFEETCYLLLLGTLPGADELDALERRLAIHRGLPRYFLQNAILSLPSHDIMNSMARSVLCLFSLDEHRDDVSIRGVLGQSLQLISAMPTLAVYGYHAFAHHLHDASLVIHGPLPEASTAQSILHMLRPDSRFSELEARVLDVCLVLHAEHGGGNNSTFTTRVVSSTGTDTYSAIAAALGSLRGPKHGGASLKAAQMFADLEAQVGDPEDDEEIAAYLNRVLDREAFDRSGLIYGMGHPVYSISDPRARILKGYARRLAEEKGREREYRLRAKVEELAARAIDERRRVYKGVSANVDFYSGFVYGLLGIPSELYTPLFAVSRIVGWCAHRIEEIANAGKIIRPAYRSTAEHREYVPLAKRP